MSGNEKRCGTCGWCTDKCCQFPLPGLRIMPQWVREAVDDALYDGGEDDGMGVCETYGTICGCWKERNNG